MARTKRRGCRKIPTLTSFGSAPSLSIIGICRIPTWLFYSAVGGDPQMVPKPTTAAESALRMTVATEAMILAARVAVKVA